MGWPKEEGRRVQESTSDGGLCLTGLLWSRSRVLGHPRLGLRALRWPHDGTAISPLLQLWGSDLPCWGSHCWTLGTEAGMLRGVVSASWASPSRPPSAWPPRRPSLHQVTEAEIAYSKGQLSGDPLNGPGIPCQLSLEASAEGRGGTSVGFPCPQVI